MTKEQFKQRRLELGLTQKQMAEKLGYSSNKRIYEKEKGDRGITKQDEIILSTLK